MRIFICSKNKHWGESALYLLRKPLPTSRGASVVLRGMRDVRVRHGRGAGREAEKGSHEQGGPWGTGKPRGQGLPPTLLPTLVHLGTQQAQDTPCHGRWQAVLHVGHL